MRVIACDTETSGLDLRHGCEPFFVTIAMVEDNRLVNKCWEWDVDPLKRKVLTYNSQRHEIQAELDQADVIVFQNGKFDITAFTTSGIVTSWAPYWHKTHDTLTAGHILASNYKHDLTSMALQYMNMDILKYEEALKDAVKKCRNKCRFHYKDWAIAKEGMPQIPSAKGTKSNDDDKSGLWANDGWLPRAMAKANNEPESHPYWTVLSDYGNVDSSATLMLWAGDGRKWHGMASELKERNLWEIYTTKLKLTRILFDMETHGATLCAERLDQLLEEYIEESALLGRRCLEIADSFGYTLNMPKGASPNDSLRRFIFHVLKCPPFYNEKAKSSAPSLNKEAMDHYLNTLPPSSEALDFIETLLSKRKKDTHIGYLVDYRRFWMPTPIPEWYTVHPHTNSTGTSTTRLSQSAPNTQNISTKEDDEGHSLRYCFGPAPGREWWSLDATNIEMRIPAYESKEQAMIELFERPADPPYYGGQHYLISHLLFPREFAECVDVNGHLDGRLFKANHKQLYKRVKNGDFAVQYGAVNRADGMGTADRTYGIKGAQSRIEAKFSKLSAHNKSCIKYAEKHGYIETIPDRSLNWNGRTPIGYPLLCTRSEWGKILPTVPLNYRTQGSAGWWLIKAMIRTHEFLEQLNKDEHTDWFITLTVHDELVFDVPYAPDIGNLPRIRVIQKLMEEGGNDIGIPTPVSVTYHPDTWEDGEQL